jgi:hypothetical protein
MVVVASGDPGVPVICWAIAGAAGGSAAIRSTAITDKNDRAFIAFSFEPDYLWCSIGNVLRHGPE